MLIRSETDDPNIFAKMNIFSYSVSDVKGLRGCAIRSCVLFCFTGVTRLHPLSRARDTTISIRSLKIVCPSLQLRVMLQCPRLILLLPLRPGECSFRFESLGGTIGP